MPTLIIDINPFDPAAATTARIPKNRKISALCPACDYPVVCLYNGVPLLRKGWNRRVKHGDIVSFVAYPRGGSGWATVLRIVVMVVAYYIGGPLGAAFAIAGNMAINAMLPTPKAPTVADMPAASPTYSLGAQGNTARIEQPIPVHYGRHLAYPDFCATPYQEYADNEQWLYQVFCIGQGYFDIEDIRIEDSSIQNFEGATWEIVEPFQKVTLFPSAVVQSDEVAGGELGSFGPFSACNAGEQSNYIGVDIVFPGGLYISNDSGGFDSKSATVRFTARLIDDLGAPAGSVFTLGEETVSGATNTAIRRSYRYSVPLGRYEVSALRVDAKDTSARVSNAVMWSGLRAYLPEDSDAGEITRLAVRLKATNQLSQQASRKVNVIATRKLPIWNPTTGWSARVATRSIAWAVADICRARYGASLADDAYDLASLYALDAIWTARGDTFDGRIDGKQTVGEALTMALRAGRAKWYQQSGQVRFWRDQLQTLPQARFQPRNIKSGSFSMDWAPAVTDTADSVRMTYFDERFWAQRDALCAVTGSAAGKPQTVNAFGMVQRRQVIDEGMYMAGDNRYRRRVVTFQTEGEGQIPRFGALVSLIHDVPSWGQSGDVIGWIAESRTAILSEPPKWVDGSQHYISLVKADGRPTANIAVSKGNIYENSVVLETDPGFVPESSGKTRERTRYAFGPSGKMDIPVLIRRISPKEGLEVEIEAIVEDIRVHSLDGSGIPDSPTSTLPTMPKSPIVSGLKVLESGSPAAPIQVASWNAAAGADHYVIEITTDGENWSPRGDTVGTSFTVVGIPAGQYLDIRVAAVGLLRGPWVSWHGVSGATVAAPGGIFDLALESPFTGSAAVARWSAAARATSYRAEIWVAGVLKRQKFITDTRFVYGYEDSVVDGGPWRNFEFRITPIGVGAGATSTLAANNPNVGQLNNVQVVSMALGALWSCQPPADEDIAGFMVYASMVNGFTPGPSNLIYEGSSAIRQLPLEPNKVWYIRCGAYDVWGKDDMALTGQFIVNTGAVQASNLSVPSLSAIVANLGEVIAGMMHSADNSVKLDLDNKKFTVADAMGQERVRMGMLGAGSYGLKVTSADGTKSVVFSPDVCTVIAEGIDTMPTALNADGTYTMEIVLNKSYDFSELLVLVNADDVPAPFIDASWTSLSTGGNTIREFHAHMSASAIYKERDGENADGRAKYKAHTISNLNREYNAVVACSVFSRWEKGFSTSGNKIYISVAKTINVFDRNSSSIKNLIEISWPCKATWAVLARNYQG